MAEKEIGTITHWFDKIGVAVIKLSGALAVGDRIKIKRGDEEFEDTVSSMQIDYKEVTDAGKGDDVAMKISHKAHEGAVVFKLE